MKRKLHYSILLIWVVAVLVTACAVQPETPDAIAPVDAENEPPVEEQAAPADETSVGEAEAADNDVETLIEERLEGSHDMARILNADKTREEWEETIDRMIGYGAKITEEEKTLMIDWLLSR